MLPFFIKLFTNAKPPPDDAELVRLYKETGDLEHVGELFQRHAKLVYLVCQKYLQDAEESKDATMQLFEHVSKALLQHEVNNFKSWLHVTTRNYCLMQLRANKHKTKVPLSDNAPPFMESAEPLHPTDAEESEKIEQALHAALKELPLQQRECVELFYLQQKSYKEISAQTGCDLNQVKSYIQNGKRNLKIIMEKNHAVR
ncbi:RNA polymerase sigma factor [Pontibacter ramchanderi]|uniref:RNA polymerase sigma-70 factor (ECF subfamily) n=1 Tax=Pontibacter ramchanderi TaxID=1179743 RepID=A0A2N3U6R1_9BACT|nr:sigma-70 family RNA polymerase sigma factor [Pontibacter ramchanderi]PKV62436.1 RNA polymerase sigma-70 factor (ECF subfamily) [Pontibacter ramchanderi]